jgi:hypothetical protein
MAWTPPSTSVVGGFERLADDLGRTQLTAFVLVEVSTSAELGEPLRGPVWPAGPGQTHASQKKQSMNDW